MTDRLYELLPTLYRVRDAAQGEPLRALMQVIGEQAQLLEDDLRQAADCLGPLIDDLPLPYREAIVLSDLQGVRLADAAKAAGVSLSGMKSRVQRGRQRLKQMLFDCCQIALDGRAIACGSTAGSCGCAKG